MPANTGKPSTSGGDRPADRGPPSEALVRQVYDELHRLAVARMAREPTGLTIQPTALVHEAYLRLLRSPNSLWENRGLFLAAAARAMRQILVERARWVGRIKHGDGHRRAPLDEGAAWEAAPGDDLLALDDALSRLEQFDPRKAQIVALRYFTGLSIEETAAALGLSKTTVKDEWMFARAWLHNELSS
ncbi:MAG: sigma-70 family RNA polymerase sigma factor [Planctomycetes bacterium]|nr:sigma-70 family RNA polymerase sigma factor [Planctomycetota bacterium]